MDTRSSTTPTHENEGEMGTPQSGQAWTETEIEAALDVYFDMLSLELNGRDFVKSDYRRRLEERLPARSKKSIEFKWCNTSAVLDEMGLPWIDGYAPMPNYQQKLREAVVRNAVDRWLRRPQENDRTPHALPPESDVRDSVAPNSYGYSR